MDKTEEQIEKEIQEEIDKHTRVLEEKMDKFLSVEKPPDVLIIKSHLICEYYLNQILILKNICTAEEIDKLYFFDKINKSFDTKDPVQKNIHGRLVKLNKLRNKVGHELEYVLTEFDVDNLGYLTGKEYIIKKYDFDKIEKLLRYTLIVIVVDISMILFKLVYREKNKMKPVSPKVRSQQNP